MKKQIRAIICKILMVLIISTLLSIVVFAETRSNFIQLKKTGTINELFEKPHKSPEKKFTGKLSLTQSSGSTNNANFKMASKFAIAIADAKHLDTDENAVKSTIVDLVYVIDSLDGYGEQTALQKVLTAVLRETTTSAEVIRAIEENYKSYANRQTFMQRWHLDLGLSVTKLIYSTYIGENTAMKKNLSEIQKLIKIAPKEVSTQILGQLKSFNVYTARTTFAEKDYQDIFAQSMKLFESMTV